MNSLEANSLVQAGQDPEVDHDRGDQKYPGTLHHDSVQRPVRVIKKAAVFLRYGIVAYDETWIGAHACLELALGEVYGLC